MRRHLWTTTLAMLAIPATAQSVEVADGNWGDIPPLEKKQTVNLTDGAMAQIDGLVESGKCRIIGNKTHIKMEIPFIVQFGANGAARRVVLKRIGCPEVETIAANAAYNAARLGRVKPGTTNQTGWYRGLVSYILE